MKPLTKRRQVSRVGLRTHLVSDKLRGTSVDTADTGDILGGECCDDICPAAA